MPDLFDALPPARRGYTAEHIEVLEGLEPVRRRPAMYIGGTDERSLHHLVAELLDNAMDEAVAGHASRIELALAADGTVTVGDNGRGIPVDPHPKFKDTSALQVILTTLHSGGKFSGKVYETSGGLHGVGLSVVNALSEHLSVEVARDRTLWRQHYSRGAPLGPLENGGPVSNRRGTTVSFRFDPQIFGSEARFRPQELYRMARSKAYLFRGVEIRWNCDAALLGGTTGVPAAEVLRFPGGLRDYLLSTLDGRATLTNEPFAGEAAVEHGAGRVEWAIAWPEDEESFFRSYCNTVPTPEGGTHEAGLRAALLRSLKGHGERTGNRAAGRLTAEDVVGGACGMLSVFIREPQFQGQTKEKLTSPAAARLVEQVVRDHFDHWLAATPEASRSLLERLVERAESRLRRSEEKKTKRQSATRKLRLPGKLADCTRTTAEGTELFLVEGDSAGGSAKAARARETQAVLPLRGKILNVASASGEKLRANQELANLVEALGCGTRQGFDPAALRYEKVIIMTDADVDGAHIAALLMTFFFREMPGLITRGHLFLAVPPLYRLTQGGTTVYARDDAHRQQLLRTTLTGRGKVEVSRFKGLGEMPSAQLKATTMDPRTRNLLRVAVGPDADAGSGRDSTASPGLSSDAARLVETLLGRRPELRFAYIQEHARFVGEVDV
ncbi:MAG: DNA topoisomerase IV subunit B [Rhodospirillales bacterium]|nr:MAG: DNA topoisomerase IV subunit B [Rhodospirillales bacterium]